MRSLYVEHLAAGPRPSVNLESICQKLVSLFALAQTADGKRFAMNPMTGHGLAAHRKSVRVFRLESKDLSRSFRVLCSSAKRVRCATLILKSFFSIALPLSARALDLDCKQDRGDV